MKNTILLSIFFQYAVSKKYFDLQDSRKPDASRDYFDHRDPYDSDQYDKWNGLEHHPDYVNPNFGKFIPGYYRISVDFQVGNSKVRSSLKTMYDTGASVCVMNKKEFNKINKASGYSLYLDNFKKIRIQQADGSLAKGYIGTTRIWTTVFDSNGHPSKVTSMEFHVFETMGSIDVIIGKNFVEEAGIQQVLEYPKTSRIEFDSGNQGMRIDQYFGLMCWVAIISIFVFRSKSYHDNYSTENSSTYNPMAIAATKKRHVCRKYSKKINTLGDVAADEFQSRVK